MILRVKINTWATTLPAPAAASEPSVPVSVPDDRAEIARHLRIVADHIEAGSMRADQHAAMLFRDRDGREVGRASFERE